MKFSRSMVSNWLKVILGALVGAGAMPAEVMAAILENIELFIGAGMAVWGLVDTWLRNVTSQPLSSWWGRK